MEKAAKNIVTVELTVAPEPLPLPITFLVECVEVTEDQLMGRRPVRMMIGPFQTFEMAHKWMMETGKKMVDTCLIHQLITPPELSRPTPTSTERNE
jgi:hypothetical protein